MALKDFSKYPYFTRCRSILKTADGNTQKVVGWLDVTVSLKGKTKPLKLFVIPPISQREILGIDFWKSYNLIPDIIGSVDMLAMDSTIDTIPNFNPGENRDQCSPPKDQIDDNFYPLLDQQRQQLKEVVDLFPNFEIQGLGRTNLI